MPAGGTSLVLEGILAGFPGLVGGDDGGLRGWVAGAFCHGTVAAVSHPLPHCMLRRSRQCGTSSVTVAVVVQHIDGIVAGTASGVRGVAGSPTTAAAAAAQACLASFPRAVGARLSTSASPQAAAATGVSTTSTTRSRRGVSS